MLTELHPTVCQAGEVCVGEEPHPIREATWAALEPSTAYAVLALRAAVFVVEQDCVYLDLDGRDLEPTTRHLWIETGDGPAAYLRVLAEGAGVHRIGRVVTAPRARGRGLAGRLLDRVVTAATGPLVLDAQSRLEPWYGTFGFERTGPDFIEDGIPHVPMRRS